MGDIGLDGIDEDDVLKGDGVLTGLTGGDLGGDLTTGAGGAAAASFNGFSWGILVASNLFSVTSGLFTGPFPGLPTGFSIISTFVSGAFSFFNFSPNFFGFTGGFFSISILASIFLSLTIAFDSIFDFVPLSVNGKIVGANFLFVMPSGIPLMLFSNLGVFGSSVKVLSLSESTSNESSDLSKIPAPNVSGTNSSVPSRSTFLYGVPGLQYGVGLSLLGNGLSGNLFGPTVMGYSRFIPSCPFTG